MRVGIKLMYVHSSVCDLNYPVVVGEILSLVQSLFSFSFFLNSIYEVIKLYKKCRRENMNDLGQEKMVNYLLIPFSSPSLKFLSSGIMLSTIK